MRNKYKKGKGFRTETEDRNSFPDIETSRPNYAVYPELNVSSSHTFMYVQNFDTRDYQVEISLSSVTKNTLVIIPTGLGKTFIAAMLIINFYRWFPTGKIIFMATSRPLVKQQMDSIKQFNIIAKKDIVEITGGVNPEIRTNHWQNSKVFFATPQTIQKDIERGVCPVSQIVLIVVDEAHHARGNHSYCQIIRKVAEITKFFRVIALTATPGSSVYDIQQVIFNLLITQIEIRTDDDCAKYIHTREIQSVIIQDAPGVAELSARLNSIIQEYLEVLLRMSLVTTKDPTRTSKGKIAMLFKENHNGEACIAMKQSLRLLNIREKLENYSIPFFTHDLEEYINSSDRIVDGNNDELKQLLSVAKKMPQTDPKMDKLCEIVVDFLQSSPEKSKVIVFCSYRHIVKEIVKKLNEASPIVKCTEFVGQSSSNSGLRGLNQPKQLKVMDAFKRGIFNVLISTSIGEEGLDIGEVDLIVCYDVQKSATRTIQRMGRTGRHQDGNVIFLLSEASKNLLHTAEKAPDSTSNLISKNINDFIFYKECPKMNENKLQLIFKKFTAEDLKNYEKQISKEKEVKRAVLLTSELEELHEHHGEKLAYDKIRLDSNIDYVAGAVFCTRIDMSNESKILADVYSSICQSSIQCSPLKSLSLSSQLSTKQEKETDDDDNIEVNFSEKSPFAIDESSSQKNYSNFLNFSQSSSQKKPKELGVRDILNIDMSTSTYDDDYDYDYDVFSKEKKKKKSSEKNKSEADEEAFPVITEEDELKHLKKSAMKDLIEDAEEVIEEATKNEKKEKALFEVVSSSSSDSDSQKVKQPNINSKSRIESFKLLASIDEISTSQSRHGSLKEKPKTASNHSNFDGLNYEDGSGFIPPNTRSESTNSNSSKVSDTFEVTKKVKRKPQRSISLISESNSEFEEEEEATSLSGFIVNSNESVQNSELLLKHVKSDSYSDSYSYSSYDDRKAKKTKNIKKNLNDRSPEKVVKLNSFRKSDNDDDDDDDDNGDVEPLNADEVSEIFHSNSHHITNPSKPELKNNNNDNDDSKGLFRIFTKSDLVSIINDEDEKNDLNDNNENFLNSSDDDFDLVMESSSFVSTSTELIESESSSFEDENLNASLHSFSEEKKSASNRHFLEKMIEVDDDDEDDEDDSDHEIQRKQTMMSKTYKKVLNDQPLSDGYDDEDDVGRMSGRPGISANNISFVPLAKLINDENQVKNLKKFDLNEESSSSSDSSAFDDSD